MAKDEPTTDDWMSDPLWYKDAIIYELHIKSFQDSNADGIGDLVGLTRRLDYVKDLGVNTIWLLPFYPSPMRDDGYDIADYRNIHIDYGTRRDFHRFVREAHRRGLKVITELVINHTSDQHPWFQAARESPPGSAKRDFYVWSDDDQRFPETRIIFTDTEASNWTWDPVAKAYYWHRFFSHQPDLNHNNPQVVKAMIRVMRFWLDIGVDGLRLDAVPYLCVRDGTSNENLPETHEVIRQMRAVVDEHYSDRMFLAEANQWPEDVREYFGDGDECHMAYHFPLMPRMYMAVAREDRHPIVEIMEQTPDIPDNCQWAVFLRNHDELTLEMVTDRERDYMYGYYATDPRMRLNVGIRRRLAPLMENDPDRIKLMFSLLMSMPGAPIIYYGDELGMGDNFFLGDRNGVRTPMQWSPDRNAGFSRADPQRLFLPPIMDPVYGYGAVNVEAQSRDPSSLLNWVKRLIAVRKAHHAFGRGTLRFLRPRNRKILAYLREYDDEAVLCVANLSHTAQPVELDLAAYREHVPIEMMGHTSFPPIGELPYLLTLAGYGIYWFRLSREADAPHWHEDVPLPADLPVLVLADGWDNLLPAGAAGDREQEAYLAQQRLTTELIPEYLRHQRWFAARGEPIREPGLLRVERWQEKDHEWLLLWLTMADGQGDEQQYFLPLSLIWSEDEAITRPLLPMTLAKVRQRSRPGILCDAFGDADFCALIVRHMQADVTREIGDGRLHFSATAAMPRHPVGDGATVRRSPQQGSNMAMVIDDQLFLKAYRRLRQGTSMELEMGRYLTQTAQFGNSIPVLGALEYEDAQGEHATMAILQAYVPNQGDGWHYTLDYLDRFIDQERLAGETPATHVEYCRSMERLGRRTAELHAALARPTDDPKFTPEPLTSVDLDGLRQELRHDLDALLQRLNAQRDLPEAAAAALEAIATARERLETFIEADVGPLDGLQKTRHHGDLHLAQVLISENDFMFIDFEGEPARPMEERRRKRSPLRDVAGMLRSFDYAAEVALERIGSEQQVDSQRLRPELEHWRLLAAGAYRDGYLQTGSQTPADGETAMTRQRLLQLFVLEKLLYESRYELEHRPGWLHIPLRALASLAHDPYSALWSEPS